MQNINSFLSACVSTFGLKPADLFSADELYYASNFPKVLERERVRVCVWCVCTWRNLSPNFSLYMFVYSSMLLV